MVRGDRTISMATNTPTPTPTCIRSHGSLIQGDYNVPDLFQGAKGWSLIGNPYAAPVQFDQVLNDAQGVDRNFFHVWDPTINTRGGYVTVNTILNQNNVSGSVANNVLDRGCAAIVGVHGTSEVSPKMGFKEDHKVSRSTTRPNWRMTESVAPTTLRMTLYDADSYAQQASAADGFVILFDAAGFNGVDEMDAPKFTNLDETIGTYNDQKAYAFETRQLPVAEEIIPLVHRQYRFTNYVYVAEVAPLNGVEAYLYDAYTNEATLLATGTTAVPFTVDLNNELSSAWNRFSIGFQNETLGNADFAWASIQVYPNPYNGQSVNIRMNQTENAQVRLVNTLGQNLPIRVQQTATGLEVIPQTVLAAGVYHLEIANGSARTIQKLIVN